MAQSLQHPFRQHKSKAMELAASFGLLIDGNNLEDYIQEAIQGNGYETIVIHGVQGSCKSARMLTMLYWVYQDWDIVLDYVVFKPDEFVTTLKEVPRGERIPALGWDDIVVNYSSSAFKTDIKQYEAIDATWAAIRTKCNVVITTLPLIDRLAKNIKDNCTFEVFIGKNQMEQIERLVRLPGLRTLETNFFKFMVERPKIFDPYFVPLDIFQRYWEMRMDLTEEALERLGALTDTDNVDGFTSVMDAADQLDLNPNYLQQMISRGVIKGRKVGGILHVSNEDVDRLECQKARKKQKKMRRIDAPGTPI